MCGGSVTVFGKRLIGGLALWIPFWLTRWLSNGFETVTLGGGRLDHRPAANPTTGQACVVLTNSQTSAPVAWIVGDSRPLDQR